MTNYDDGRRDKGARMIQLMKEQYQSSETDLALYVGAHQYEDVPGKQQVVFYTKGNHVQLGKAIAHYMQKSPHLRKTIMSAMNKYLVDKHGREQLMDVLRLLEMYKDAQSDTNNNNTNEA